MSAPADTLAVLKARFPRVAERASLDHPALDVPTTDLFAVLRALRDDHDFDLLSDLTAFDAGVDVSPRFHVVYHLLAIRRAAYVRVVVACESNDSPEVPSAVPLWPGANWHEREAFDMFGVRFAGHPDLRRILMWDEYPHFPLRKEFPLAGIDAPLPDAEVAAESGSRAAPAPMAGGPFVATPVDFNLTESEPRAKDESWTEKKEKPD
jgi:NADH-quinone oxidoreductase subunit C